MVVWEKHNSSEILQAGRHTDFTPPSLWPDKIVEIEFNAKAVCSLFPNIIAIEEDQHSEAQLHSDYAKKTVLIGHINLVQW
ncbi:MAG: hypothetical protein K9G41_02945 [Flavobacteriales bacterium]|nr:hypothetical protein [Flavobacteriales bacterium]